MCAGRADEGWATNSRTTASHRSAVWLSHAVTVKATCSEGIRSSRVAKTVPSALTLKSTLLVSYWVPLVPRQLLNETASGKEDRVRTSPVRRGASRALTWLHVSSGSPDVQHGENNDLKPTS